MQWWKLILGERVMLLKLRMLPLICMPSALRPPVEGPDDVPDTPETPVISDPPPLGQALLHRLTHAYTRYLPHRRIRTYTRSAAAQFRRVPLYKRAWQCVYLRVLLLHITAPQSGHVHSPSAAPLFCVS